MLECFLGKVRIQGDSKIITIPSNMVELLKLNNGDLIYVMLERKEVLDDEVKEGTREG